MWIEVNGLNQVMVSQVDAEWVTMGQHPISDFELLFCSIGAYVNMLCIYRMVMQVGQKFSSPPVEDIFYNKTRSMLHNLGLQNYEKNFRNGLLTDSTLPLLTDRQVVGFSSSYILKYFLPSS
jgi:hypothetical protein